MINSNSPTSILQQCFSAWSQLKYSPLPLKMTNTTTTKPHYPSKAKLRLKKIYTDMMFLKFKNHNTFIPTPTQKEIMPFQKLQDAFVNSKKIIHTKGKDLIWRYLLKALPKSHSTNCPHCNEPETSEHIFFKCKQNEQAYDLIRDCLYAINHEHINWNKEILTKLDIPTKSEITSIAFDWLWLKRNNQIHKDRKSPKFSMKYIMNKATTIQHTAWSKTLDQIHTLLRILHKNPEDKKAGERITTNLEKFNKNFNFKPLKQITCPEYLESFKSLRSN